MGNFSKNRINDDIMKSDKTRNANFTVKQKIFATFHFERLNSLINNKKLTTDLKRDSKKSGLLRFKLKN